MDDLTVNPGAEGYIRTYYGEAMSQISVSTRNAVGSGPEHSTSAHLIGVGDQDAHEILHINEQPYPWLFKIGVF